MPEPTDLEFVETLFAFLQGDVPDGIYLEATEVPSLTAEQAWTTIWYLQNTYRQVPDRIERCEICGELYDAWSEGACLDYGDSPYHFCGNCMDGREYRDKKAKEPR